MSLVHSMDSQHRLTQLPPGTRITLESGDVLLENGRAGVMLDYIVTESTNPVSQKDQSVSWQVALMSLANVMPHLLEPRARRLIGAVRSRFPAAIAAYEHPLACLSEQGSLRYALLRILSTLADMARTDKTLYKALHHHGIPYIGVLTWLSGHDAVRQDSSEESAEAASSCLAILDTFQDYEQIIPQATAKLGFRLVAKHLIAAFRLSMQHEHFAETCLLASSMVEFSPPQMSHELLRNGVPVRVGVLFWEVLAREPKETNIRSNFLGPVLGFMTNTMAHTSALGDAARTAFFIEMVKSCDLASLCTLASYRSATKNRVDRKSHLLYDELQIQQVTKGVVAACAECPDLISTHVLPCFLPALDHLRDLGAQAIGHLDEVINVWVSLTDVSSTEGSLEEVVTLSEVGARGCSWYQCIFHCGYAEGAMARPMFIDNSCRRAQYCSRYCQKRDWKDGGHKRQCTPARAS